MFQKEALGKVKTRVLCSIMFPDSSAFCMIMWKNKVETDRLQMTIQYGACPLRAG